MRSALLLSVLTLLTLASSYSQLKHTSRSNESAASAQNECEQSDCWSVDAFCPRNRKGVTGFVLQNLCKASNRFVRGAAAGLSRVRNIFTCVEVADHSLGLIKSKQSHITTIISMYLIHTHPHTHTPLTSRLQSEWR